MSQPLVISVILNTNRRDDTLDCLASLAESTYVHHKTIVLDNHSKDGSVSAIRAAFPEVDIIELDENLGYAGNNNVGIEAAMTAGADWVFVLNEDTVLANDCLNHLVDAGESDPGIGIVGPMVYHHDEPNVIQSAGGKLSRYWQGWHVAENEPDRSQFKESHAVDWVSGCGIMVRRSVVDEVGMLDKRFFYYWEETEWCVRAGRAGWQILHVPQAKLWHKGVQREYQPNPSVTYYNTRNRFLMMYKHRAPISAWVQAWIETGRTLLSWSIKPKWRSKREHRSAMWRGSIDFLLRRWGQMPA